jgi:DNA-binding response OmpR family regulator
VARFLDGVKKDTNEFRVLVVEDNEGLAFIIQIVLEAQGYQVRTARDGGDGYLAYLLFMPDLVITDIQMPKVNGLEMMRAIRMHDPKVRTIYLSGELSRFRSLLEDEQKMYSIDLLRKPFSSIELIRLVSKIFTEVSEYKREL